MKPGSDVSSPLWKRKQEERKKVLVDRGKSKEINSPGDDIKNKMNLEDLLVKRKTVKCQITKTANNLIRISGKDKDGQFKLEELNKVNVEYENSKLSSYIEDLKATNT